MLCLCFVISPPSLLSVEFFFFCMIFSLHAWKSHIPLPSSWQITLFESSPCVGVFSQCPSLQGDFVMSFTPALWSWAVNEVLREQLCLGVSPWGWSSSELHTDIGTGWGLSVSLGLHLFCWRGINSVFSDSCPWGWAQLIRPPLVGGPYVHGSWLPVGSPALA